MFAFLEKMINGGKKKPLELIILFPDLQKILNVVSCLKNLLLGLQSLPEEHFLVVIWPPCWIISEIIDTPYHWYPQVGWWHGIFYGEK